MSGAPIAEIKPGLGAESSPAGGSTSSNDPASTVASSSSSPPSPETEPPRIWSPSQTADFSRCPKYWDLGRRWERWKQGEWTPDRAVGAAIHAGLADYFSHLDDHDRSLSPSAVDVVISSALKAEWPENAPEIWDQGAMFTIAKRAVVKTVDEIALPVGAQIVGVEHSFGEAIVDLIYLHEGELTVLDWKSSYELKREWVAKRLEEATYTWAFYHYAWRAREKWQRPVRSIVKVVIACTPTTFAKKREVPLEPGFLERWHEQALSMWAEMEDMRAGRRVVYQRYEGCGLYGGCVFRTGCFDLAGDESKFGAMGYEVKDWSRWEAVKASRT